MHPDEMKRELRVYGVQLLAAALYTLLLESVRPFYEKHQLTETTVIGGTVLAFAPAWWLARRLPTSWRCYERRAFTGFAVSALPITIWQLWLFICAHRQPQR